jgi:SAM-dependent methyltransferase
MTSLRHAFQQSDLVERHTVVARILAQSLPGQQATVLDVGGRRGLLAEYTPLPVTAINPDGTADLRLEGDRLPFGAGAFDAVVTIDTLEHVPPAQRLPFVQECARVARKLLIVAAPYGSPEHIGRERELNEVHRSVYGHYHQYLNEHVENGLPTADEIDALTAAVVHKAKSLYYAGDYTWQARMFEQSVNAARRGPIVARLLHLYNRVAAAAVLHPIKLEKAADAQSNRFYLVMELDQDS